MRDIIVVADGVGRVRGLDSHRFPYDGCFTNTQSILHDRIADGVAFSNERIVRLPRRMRIVQPFGRIVPWAGYWRCRERGSV